MPTDLFKKWLMAVASSYKEVSLYRERSGTRTAGLQALKKLLVDYFVGEATILQAGGYKKAAAIVTNSLPTNKKTRSGDLGELLATEYVNLETSFVAPINKLRWKSDRQTAMHGNDVIAVDATKKPIQILKGECKSGANMGTGPISDAVETLDLHDGRPNPSTLAFIAKRLYEEKRDSEADIFRDLQCGSAIASKNITHMIFALSGNDPAKHLATAPKSKYSGIKRTTAAIVIPDHGAFIELVFKTHGT